MSPFTLRSGAASVLFEPDCAYLRHLNHGSLELVRAIYLAVRGEDWSTANNSVEELSATESSADWIVVSRGSRKHVVWRCHAELTERSFAFTADGSCQNAFTTNRTGLCVLHPSTQAGSTVIVHHPNGERSRGVFPIHVAPHQPLHDIEKMDVGLNGGRLRIEFEGEVFETEDQRNWSDDSFKTYCRPLDWPKPYRVEEGECIRHAVRLSFSGIAAELGVSAGKGGIDTPLSGLGTMLGPTPIADWQIGRIARLGLRHLAVEPNESNLKDALRILSETNVQRIQAHVSEDTDISTLADLPLSEIVVHHAADPTPYRSFGVPVIASSPENFTELNRQPPDSAAFDGVGFATNPQVHAFDDRSIIETVQTHKKLLDEAEAIAMGKPVHVGPITFEPRRWKDKDARLQSELGVRWTLASVVQFQDAASLTYYRTHGPGGIVGDDPASVSPIEALFLALREAEGLEYTRSNSELREVRLLGLDPLGINVADV